MSIRLFAAAALLAIPASAHSQEVVRLDPKEALQCAMWASTVYGQTTNADTQAVMNGAMGYFLGQYEGATGRSIIDGHDEAAAREVMLDPNKFSAPCMRYIGQYSSRMVDWGTLLTELGRRVEAARTSDDGQ